MKKTPLNRHALSTALLVFSLFAGCMAPDPVTRENYDRLKLGMTYEAVTAILGETQHISTRLGIKQYTWVSGERHIHAKFIADRAVYYSSKGLDAAANGKTPRPGN